MQEGIASEDSNDKKANVLALANLQNRGKGGFQGNCKKCGKLNIGNKTNPQRSGNNKHCNFCHQDGHTESECYRQLGNHGYEKFKEWTPKGINKEVSNKQAILRLF